jgi:hypothetical protein
VPSLATNLQTQDYQYAVQVPQGTWRWTTRVDVSKAVVTFQVRDIVSPFGLLRDNIPLPGPVITAMSESITELQSAFAPLIGLSPTTLTFTTTQGQGFGTPQVVTVSNNGVYGSLLSPAVTSSAAYVLVTPANMGGLAFGASGQFNASVDGTDLLATSSPYTATLTVQDPNATNTPQTIAVTINVLPEATIALSPTSLSFSATGFNGVYPLIPTQTFQVQNTGPSGSVLSYQIQKLIGLSPWLVGFTPTFGTVSSGGSVNITVNVQPTSCFMQPGTYSEILRVSGYSSNFYQDLTVTLTLS